MHKSRNAIITTRKYSEATNKHGMGLSIIKLRKGITAEWGINSEGSKLMYHCTKLFRDLKTIERVYI